MDTASLSSYSVGLRRPAFSLSLPPNIYVSGCSICGELEVDYQMALEDDIERIFIELHGVLQTKNRLRGDSDQFETLTNEFLQKPMTLWLRGRSLPPDHGEISRIPFELKLPEDVPPSFLFETFMNNASVRYSLEVTGIRSGTFALDRTVKVPLVILQPDPIGSGIRAQMKLGWQGPWGRLKHEMEMRKYPWGEYGRATMELLVPHVDTFPLFTDIPYTIVFTTFSPPLKRKGDTPPGKDIFPIAPRNPSEVEFELRRRVDMKTPYEPSNPEEHVADIISKVHAATPPIEVEVGDYVWVPDAQKPERGQWMQEVTYQSIMNLRFTPTFLTEEIKLKYTLCLRCEFPGLGNVLRVELPINIGSGVETTFPAEQRSTSPRMIDLPASYWNPSRSSLNR